MTRTKGPHQKAHERARDLAIDKARLQKALREIEEVVSNTPIVHFSNTRDCVLEIIRKARNA